MPSFCNTHLSMSSFMHAQQIESPEVLDEVLEELGVELGKKLIVYNDDINTFDHVIDTLIKVCRHTTEQAEQCTWIIHFKGKCAVKEGTYHELLPLRTGITDRGISAEIE